MRSINMPVQRKGESDDDFNDRENEFLHCSNFTHVRPQHDTEEWLTSLDESLKEFDLEIEVVEDFDEVLFRPVRRV